MADANALNRLIVFSTPLNIYLIFSGESFPSAFCKIPISSPASVSNTLINSSKDGDSFELLIAKISLAEKDRLTAPVHPEISKQLLIL